jgi:hypothetical protein
MKRLVLGLLVILFSIQTIGCNSEGGGGAGTTDSPAPAASAAPAAGKTSKGVAAASKVSKDLANPDGPKNDR